MSGLEEVRSKEDVKEDLKRMVISKYVAAKTITELKDLVGRKERGEIAYCFIAVRRNGDKVFAVEGLVN